MERKTIAVDLDGIITKEEEWQGPEHFGELIPGVIEKLEKYSKDHELILHSCRLAGHYGDTLRFLERVGILEYFSKCTAVKPPADHYLDNRASSSWEELERKLGTTGKEIDYPTYVISFVIILSGLALILEHLITWHGFDLEFGHEWIGLILIISGMLMGLKKNRNDRRN